MIASRLKTREMEAGALLAILLFFLICGIDCEQHHHLHSYRILRRPHLYRQVFETLTGPN